MSIIIEYKSEQALKKLMQHPAISRVGARKGLTYVGKFFVKTASNKIKDKTKKTGRIYKYKGKRYRASAPGEYPANRSGANRRGLGFAVKSSEELHFGNRLQKEYPTFLEQGSPGGKIKRRSYLERTIKDNEEKSADIAGEEIYKALTKL